MGNIEFFIKYINCKESYNFLKKLEYVVEKIYYNRLEEKLR